MAIQAVGLLIIPLGLSQAFLAGIIDQLAKRSDRRRSD
jgi:hypothetical protein